MADYNKQRFYWIKLRTDFYDSDEKIDYLMSQKNGSDYVVLYQMLCLKSANNQGNLSYSVGEMLIPFNVEKIVRDCKYFSKDTVIVALNLYKQLGLIYVEENGSLQIAGFEQMIGSQTISAHKKEMQLLRRGGKEGGKKSTKRIENRDKDIRDIDNRDKACIYNTHARATPTIEDIKNYCRETNSPIDPQYFFDYYESIGWVRGGQPIVDWKTALRSWERNGYDNAAVEQEEPKYSTGGMSKHVL